MKNRSLLIKAAGTILIMVSVFFVAAKIYENRVVLLEWRLTLKGLVVLSLCVLLYALDKIFIGLAWHRLTVFFGNKSISLRDNVKIYIRTQIAKYIPGNIFHFIGRHAACKSVGFTHSGLVGALAYEMAGLISSAGLLAIAGMALWEFRFSSVGLTVLPAVVCLAALTPVCINFLANRIKFLKDLSIEGKTYKEVFSSLSIVYTLYLLFFIISGAIFYSLILLFDGKGGPALIGPAVTVYALSWVVGYITPGASGGMGVREAVIIGFLSGIVGQAESVVVALAFRLVTTLGDCLVFGLSFLIPSLK